MRQLSILMILLMGLVGCSKKHPLSPSTTVPPTMMLSVSTGPSLPSSVDQAVSELDTVGTAPATGATFNVYNSSHQPWQPTATEVDGQRLIWHTVPFGGHIWQPGHKALWQNGSYFGPILSLKSSDGSQERTADLGPGWDSSPYAVIGYLSFTRDGKPAFAVIGDNQYLWHNNRKYTTNFDPTRAPVAAKLNTANIAPQGNRWMVTYQPYQVADQGKFPTGGCWDIDASTGSGYCYWADSLVGYAEYGRTDRELIIFVGSPSDDLSPSCRLYRLKTDGAGSILSSELIAPSVRYPKGYWMSGTVPAVTTSRAAVLYSTSAAALWRFDLNTGATSMVMSLPLPPYGPSGSD